MLSDEPVEFRPTLSKQNHVKSCLNCFSSIRLTLKVITSPLAFLGRPLKHASEVRAKTTPQLPKRNPIC